MKTLLYYTIINQIIQMKIEKRKRKRQKNLYRMQRKYTEINMIIQKLNISIITQRCVSFVQYMVNFGKNHGATLEVMDVHKQV